MRKLSTLSYWQAYYNHSKTFLKMELMVTSTTLFNPPKSKLTPTLNSFHLNLHVSIAEVHLNLGIYNFLPKHHNRYTFFSFHPISTSSQKIEKAAKISSISGKFCAILFLLLHFIRGA
jgi:hypothetical protein